MKLFHPLLISCALIFSLSAAVSSPAGAQESSSDSSSSTTSATDSSSPKHWKGPNFFKKLGLSDDQKSQIKSIRQSFKAQFSSLKDQINTEKAALGALLTAHSSLTAAQAEQQKLQVLFDQMGTLRFQEMYDVGGVLTAEQRQKLSDMRQKMAEHWKSRRGHHQDSTPAEAPSAD